ncbi:MAG: hypothetical protein K5778_07480 [Bacteroidaceae bacterium]|nr:hypothetical protein [Bacteroidaceae bacterium]MDO4994933.1 hypothetical protein [Bacteroidales bacterium]
MKQFLSTLGLLAVLTIIVCIGAACTSSVKPNENAQETAQQDSVQSVELDAEKVAAGKSFIESFYQDLEDGFDEDEIIQQYLNPNAVQWLKNMFDYDCPDENCMAFYKLTSDYTGDEGPLQDLIIEAVDNNTFIVTHVYDTPDGLNEYGLQFTLVQEGDTYKIDAIESMFNRFDGKDQYAVE